MAEMLVRVVDKVNQTDKRLDAQCSKRGDVIWIADDKHEWTRTELSGDPWIVVKVPGVPIEDLSAYMAPEPFDPVLDTKLPQRKAFKFDIDAYEKNPRDLTRVEALAAKLTKPIIPDSDVLSL